MTVTDCGQVESLVSPLTDVIFNNVAIEYCVTDGTIDLNDDGGDNIAVTAGKYRVQMDLANGTYTLNKIQ